MGNDLDDLKNQKIVVIGEDIIAPVSKFLRYCLCGSFHLNKFAGGSSKDMRQLNDGALKRKRIVTRMSEGLNPGKRRRFTISKVKESLQSISPDEIEEQLKILTVHVVIEKPSRKSARLIRNLSNNAKEYLRSECLYSDNEIALLIREIATLAD